MSIQVNALSKIYGEQKAVDNISFTAGAGEIVGFLGPNGAGKSTTMKMITGYLIPDAGEITVCGIDVKKHPLESKKKIGYLPEANPLYYDMYVREYLDFIAGVHNVPAKKQRIEEVIAMVGLTPESRKKIGQLSKGYKQRVGLAAALIHDPEVLILDEPTTGLDPNQIIEIREVIRQLGKQKTILFSSHILQEVEALCQRVVIINKGKLVADNALDKLRNQSHGAGLVKVSFREPADAGLLRTIPGVESVKQTTEKDFELAGPEPAAIMKSLFSFAPARGLEIISVQTEEQKLEDIFRNLTQQSPEA